MGAFAALAILGGVVHLWNIRPRHAVATWEGAPLSGGPPVTFGVPLDRYVVTYLVDTGAPLGSGRVDEVLSVDRPFSSRLVTTTHGSVEVAGDQTSTLGKLRINGLKGQRDTVLGVPVDLALTDARVEVSLDALDALGLARRREQRVVAGRPCQVVRAKVPLTGSSPLGVFDDASHVDSCVDARGLVLAQVEESDGKVIARRVATRVDEHPTFAPHLFDVEEDVTVPVAKGGIQTVRSEADLPGRSYVLDSPPDGFARFGRFAVAEGSLNGQDGQAITQRRGSFSEVWVRGRDVLVLDQGATEFGATALVPFSHAAPVDLGPLGPGEAILGPRLSQVRITLTGGRYVRVAGTLGVDALADVARTLRTIDTPPQAQP